MSPEQIIAVLTTLLSGQADTSAFDALRNGGPDPRYPVAIVSCVRPLAPLEIEGQTVICGTVDVPENHAKPDGNRIKLQFAVLKAHSEAPAPDPVIYLHGGPGGSALEGISAEPYNFGFLRDRRDIILFDQRASGITSQAMACYGSMTDDFFESLTRPKSGETADSDDSSAHLASCLEEVSAKGVVLADYNTTENAYDVRALVGALGYGAYNIYGISYGTLLSQEVMRSAPDNVRSVVIDSIVPADVRTYDTNGVPLDQMIGAVVDQCTADAACAAGFPDLEATINATAAKLKATPIPATSSRAEINLETLIHLFIDRNSIVNIPNTTAFIPQIVTEWGAGTSATYELLLSGITRRTVTADTLAGQYVGKIPQDQLILAYALAAQAEQLTAADKATTLMLQQLAIGRATPGNFTNLESLLDKEISAAIKELDIPTILGIARSYGRLLGQAPERRKIVDWLTDNFVEPQRSHLLSVLALMSESDVTAFFMRAQRDLGPHLKAALGTLDLAVYACQESIPFNSLEGLQASVKEFRFPFLEQHVLEDTAEIFEFCKAFTPVPRAGFHDAVVSDLPTLALAGLNDTQTNGDAAVHVSQTLSHAQALTLPEAGHGVMLFSQCARDIAAAFIEHPDQAADSRCIAKLKPQFYIPPKAP